MKTKIEITKWNETLMADSFGDLTSDEFDRAAAAYVEAVKAAYPTADVVIDIESGCVGSPLGLNEVEFSDGSTAPVAEMSDEFFHIAIAATY